MTKSLINKAKYIFLTLLFVILVQKPAFSSSYCDEYDLGWHFYCSDGKKIDKKPKKQITKKVKQDHSNHQEQMAKMKEVLDEKKSKAIIYPTEANVRDYMQYQKMVLDKSSTFADVWRRVVWKNPSLDYTMKRPVSKMGKEAWIDNRNSDTIKTIKNINKRYGVFFLFRSDCPFCHKYSPILRSFQKKYKISIMAISMDGKSLPNWPDFMVDRGHVKKMGLKLQAVPATLLFDKKTRKVIPIGFGVLSHSDLEERIYATVKLEVGNDF